MKIIKRYSKRFALIFATLIFTLILISCSVPSDSDNSIKKQEVCFIVLDKSTNDPIEGASIEVHFNYPGRNPQGYFYIRTDLLGEACYEVEKESKVYYFSVFKSGYLGYHDEFPPRLFSSSYTFKLSPRID